MKRASSEDSQQPPRAHSSQASAAATSATQARDAGPLLSSSQAYHHSASAPVEGVAVHAGGPTEQQPSAAPAVPFLSPLERLDPRLQRRIAAYIHDSREGIDGVGLASRACRQGLLSGIRDVMITDKPLARPKHGTTHAMRAASLARLLALFPEAESFFLYPAFEENRARGRGHRGGQEPPPPGRVLTEMFGRACLLLDVPLSRVNRLQGYVTAGGRDPHPLAQALAAGRLPALQDVDWDLWGVSHNAGLLRSAVQLGHQTQQRTLEIDNGPLADALGRVLDLSVPGQPRLPQLRELSISTYENEFSLSPLVRAFGPDGGAPNLTRLETEGYTRSHMIADIGAMYAAGGLVHLEELRLDSPESPGIVDAGVALLEGTAASGHRRAALRSLVM